MQRGRGRRDARRGAGVAKTAPAILAAGGLGSRSGSAQPKQFTPLGGKPLFRWALDDLLAAGCTPVIFVVPAGHVDEARAATADLASVEVIEGGATRRDSVAAGLGKVSDERVVVHDAARPCAGADLVVRVTSALVDVHGVIPVFPVDETLKRVNDETPVTVDRSDVFLAQTPQAFDVEFLRSAHDRAASEGVDATDDAELIERYGGKVVTVPGHRRNIKVTWAEDLELAEAFLSR